MVFGRPLAVIKRTIKIKVKNGGWKSWKKRGPRSPEASECWKGGGGGGVSDGKVKKGEFVRKFSVILKKFMRNISWLLKEKTGVM